MCIIHSTVARTRWRKVFDARIYCAEGWLIARNAVREKISMTTNKYRATVQSGRVCVCVSSMKLEYIYIYSKIHEDDISLWIDRNLFFPLLKFQSYFSFKFLWKFYISFEEDDSWCYSRNQFFFYIYDLRKQSHVRIYIYIFRSEFYYPEYIGNVLTIINSETIGSIDHYNPSIQTKDIGNWLK